MKGKIKKERGIKGITLIALVITIIVLLILAGVSIATLAGENGILEQGRKAKEETQKNEAIEQAKLDIIAWQAEQMEKGESADLTDAKVKEILTGKSYVKDGEPGNTSFIMKDGEYIIEYSTLYETSSTEFSPETFKLSTPVLETIEKYGWIVNGYNKTTEEYTTGIWKLFYQDSGYTYLIADNIEGIYNPEDYYGYTTKEDGQLKYQTGADVSKVGQKLSKMLLDEGTYFVEDNTNPNIRTTAWLTDIELDMWKEYKNDDAVFAIGALTLELYKASFDATSNINNATKFEIEVGEFGYNVVTTNYELKNEYNYGIYNNYTRNWLASPNNENGFYLFTTRHYRTETLYNGYVANYDVYGIRPVVCIPTTVFNAKYASTMVQPTE